MSRFILDLHCFQKVSVLAYRDERVIHIKRFSVTETAAFVILSVQCFQRKPL